MDEIVLAAMRKWPNVPHCHGWLALDARGDWYLRDESAQQAGPFPAVKGSRIEHAGLKDFIGRNYLADGQGRWYFQNGPQRVYVQLEAAPWVWRVTAGDEGVALTTHTGAVAVPRGSFVDEAGRLFADSDLGFGLVHSQDMVEAARAIEQGHWVPEPVRFADAPARFGFLLDPRQGVS
jgi:hypothetical protein